MKFRKVGELCGPYTYLIAVLILILTIGLIYVQSKLKSQIHSYQLPPPKPVVDAVITYVNGSDPRHLRYLHKHLAEAKLRFSGTSHRFSDHGDLKFLLRSIERYAKFFRYIFLVVAYESQIPSWLNLNHPKLKIIFHSDIWKDPTQLPNFNSVAIEANLHHIKDLSNYYVYFNDDFLILQQLEISDFFNFTTSKNGELLLNSFLVRYETYKIPETFTPESSMISHWLNSGVLSANIIAEICRPATLRSIVGFRRYHSHTPYTMLKFVMEEIENSPNIIQFLEQTWSSRFRSSTCVSTFPLIHWYAQCKMGIQATQTPAELFRINMINFDKTETKMTHIPSLDNSTYWNKYKYLLISDERDSEASKERMDKLVNTWRTEWFPEKSLFEI